MTETPSDKKDPTNTGAQGTELDQKTALAKAILERAVAVNDPYRNVPKEEDERVRRAQSILSGAVQKAKETSDVTAAANKSLPDDMRSRLPQSHLAMLREYFWDPFSNDYVPYFLGSLKSFSSKSGYGFIECPQSHQHWGVDVFVHKNQVPVPWSLGQPVEFSVIVNNEGRPQASDTNWLPKVPQKRAGATGQVLGANVGVNAANAGVAHQPGIFSPNDPSRRIPVTAPPSAPSPSAPSGYQGEQSSSTAGTGETPPVPTESKTTETATDSAEAARPKRSLADGPFYIGTLKSYSAAQGYGFLHCEELHQQFSRDIYFDRSQLCRVYNTGMHVEFQITLNPRGQPQARNVFWNPLPVAPVENKGRPEVDNMQNVQKIPSHASVEKARKLLRLLNGNECEQAIVAAIDYQGAEKIEPRDANNANITTERSIDFVSFVLDRIDATADQEQAQLQDFVKMLLLLMLAKMLNKRFNLDRVKKFAKWLQRYTTDLNTKQEAQVAQHFQEVSQQICDVLTKALAENSHTTDPEVSSTIHSVMEQLKEKALSMRSAQS